MASVLGVCCENECKTMAESTCTRCAGIFCPQHFNSKSSTCLSCGKS